MATHVYEQSCSLEKHKHGRCPEQLRHVLIYSGSAVPTACHTYSTAVPSTKQLGSGNDPPKQKTTFDAAAALRTEAKRGNEKVDPRSRSRPTE